MSEKWDRRFLGLAFYVAEWSKDPSTRCGAVLVHPLTRTILGTGYNGLPRGVADTDARLQDREIKYQMTAHAEVNAIYTAARQGVTLEGMTIFCSFQPCSICTAAIIQTGLKRVVTTDAPIPERWDESMKLARDMMEEAKVQFYRISMIDELSVTAKVLHMTSMQHPPLKGINE